MDHSHLKKFIPKNKSDFEPFSELMEISENEIKHILPELLEWIADPNWPIANDMINVLSRFPNSVIPLIKEILNSNDPDEGWQNVIIAQLIPRFPVHLQRKFLLEDIKKIIIDSTAYKGYESTAVRYMRNFYGDDVMEKVLPLWISDKQPLDSQNPLDELIRININPTEDEIASGESDVAKAALKEYCGEPEIFLETIRRIQLDVKSVRVQGNNFPKEDKGDSPSITNP